MATEIKMPQLSDTMSAGKILAWRKNEGDRVARGEILAEVETDKANLEIECFSPGVLLKILVPAQSTAQVGQTIAMMGQAGETVAAQSSNQPPAPANTVASAEPSSSPPPPQAIQAAPAHDESESASGRVKASPLARKVARERNIDLSLVTGSGPHGRIVRKDVESSSGPSLSAAPRSVPTSAPVRTPSSGPLPGNITPLSKMRETIARRMQESVREAPHFYVSAAIEMDEAVRLREVLKGKPEYKGISLNHLVIKACAYALQNEPRVNCSMRDGQLFEPDQINIGIITAIEDGLLIPVVREANLLALKDVVFEARAAVDRARAGRPLGTDLVGGTFSISNMGMFDVENFTAIINPGQGGVLAVSSVHDEPVVRNGAIVVGKRMRVTVSVDHRVIDGVMAGTFLKFFKEGLETPALLM